MIYLITQIALFLLIAVVLGISFGWWTRGMKTTASNTELEGDQFDIRHRLEQCHRDNSMLRRDLKSSEDKVIKLSNRLSHDNTDRDDLHTQFENSQAKVVALIEDLQWRDDEISALKEELKAASNNALPADDLSLIYGIDQQINQLLSSVGVDSFRQIITMSEEEIQALDDSLELGGRIMRDNWQIAAQKLYTIKYG